MEPICCRFPSPADPHATSGTIDILKANDLHIVEKLTDSVSTLLKRGHTCVEIPETGRTEEQDLSQHRSKSLELMSRPDGRSLLASAAAEWPRLYGRRGDY